MTMSDHLPEWAKTKITPADEDALAELLNLTTEQQDRLFAAVGFTKSDHLPECDGANPRYSSVRYCICDRLRACEARVRSAELAEAKALLASRDEAWLAGLDAAREAVITARDANTAPDGRAITSWGVGWDESMTAALAAIDALRGES